VGITGAVESLAATETADLRYMARALELAEHAASLGEVPVGAVLVRDGAIIGEGWNQVISSADPTAHAECMSLRNAAQQIGNYRLPGSVLYVTLEPCTMCTGAMVHARVSELVFAAREPRAGVICSRANTLEADYYNHRVRWREGPLAAESAACLQSFFRRRR
jgi:tRNA(adenine34) deaminase